MTSLVSPTRVFGDPLAVDLQQFHVSVNELAYWWIALGDEAYTFDSVMLLVHRLFSRTMLTG